MSKSIAKKLEEARGKGLVAEICTLSSKNAGWPAVKYAVGCHVTVERYLS